MHAPLQEKARGHDLHWHSPGAIRGNADICSNYDSFVGCDKILAASAQHHGQRFVTAPLRQRQISVLMAVWWSRLPPETQLGLEKILSTAQWGQLPRFVAKAVAVAAKLHQQGFWADVRKGILAMHD